MANEDLARTTGQQEPSGADSGGLMKKIFTKKDEAPAPPEKDPAPKQGVAHIPATLLTVEYIDESEGMDAALKVTSERLQKIEHLLGTMQETQHQLISTMNQQAKELARYVESIGRRVDRLYRKVCGGDAGATWHGTAPSLAEEDAAEPEEAVQEEPLVTESTGLAPSVAKNPEHQNAWRIARVLAADLEAYHEEDVKEGVLYGTFYNVLRGPIEKARHTYEERVSKEIVDNYDYFSKALDELIARKRIELQKEGAV